jgi:cytoskeletal protein CcmA (bactofilin family)
MTPQDLRRKVNPLSEKHKSARYSQSRTDTLIGGGTRIEGNITFTGVLCVDGAIIGDVSCDDGTHGTIVVSKLGSVTGAIKAPHVVVFGRVDGPVHSSQSIEIHQGARVVGGGSYRDIVIHEGGVIEGVLTPRVPTQEDQSGQVHHVQSLEPPAVKKSDEPPANVVTYGNEIGKGSGKARNFGVAIALLITVIAIVWMNVSPTAVKPPAADVELKANNPATVNPASQSSPVESTTPSDSPKAVTASAVPVPPSSETVTKGAVQATPPDTTELGPIPVVVVRGDDASKPVDFVFVVNGKAPTVLLKKQRKDPAEGTRIDVAQGTSKRIAIAKDDVLRAEEGRGLQMFFQGRKVASAVIESGAWISFVPNSRSGANDQ